VSFGPLVSAGWLRDRLGDPGLVVVDCRYVLGEPEAGERGWRAGHLPGAAYLDVDRDLADPPGAGGRHPLPAPERFEAAALRAGIGPESRVVAYDEAGEGGAARLWWLLRHFAHEEVAVLDGGLRGWRAEGGTLEAHAEGEARAAHAEGEAREASSAGDAPEGGGRFRAEPRERDFVDAAEIERSRPRLLDARAPERYRGEVEPIDAVAGHIPGADNVPWQAVAPEGRFLSPDELRARLGDQPFVAYCGSGVTACTLIVAAELAGVEARLYPGSWSEWSGSGRAVESG
jgi:thiosulfate/3-mercaptopyruvate sulfurtransferase